MRLWRDARAADGLSGRGFGNRARLPVVFAIGLSAFSLSAGARLEVGTMRLKTYPFGDPDPVPAPTERRYPYGRYDGTSVSAVETDWQYVRLENDNIRVTVLPQIGGKVWEAYDKVAGRDFLYCNHVLKFRNIALRGPWTSGGIEYNFGILGHAPSSSTPVDWYARTNDDLSVSCFLSAPEYVTRTIWQVEVRLGLSAANFETRVTWFNGSGLAQPLYHWMNAAYSVRNDPSFEFPGKLAIGHEGEVCSRPWPYDAKGRRVDRYSGNDYGGNKSYHILPGNNGYFAIWWRGLGFGSYHRNLPYEKFGRKLWLWAHARSGAIWEDLLTDSDGQYAELQSGLCFNQPRGGTYLTPFKHPTFAAGATLRFAEEWGPVRSRMDISAEEAVSQPEERPATAPKEYDWNSAWGLYVRGVQYLRERMDAKGAASLKAATEIDPCLTPALTALAGYEFRRGNVPEVRALCRRVLAIDAYDAEANYLDGFAAFVENEQATARERLGVAALDPRFASAAYALVARSYLREGKGREAGQAAEKSLSANPLNCDAMLALLVSTRDRPKVAAVLARVFLKELPLFHGARYELGLAERQKDFNRYVKNELAAETYLELGAWYEETGLAVDARRMYALAASSLLAKVHLQDYAAARRLPVAGVFPFRRESLPALQEAVSLDGHWKFKYLLAVLKAHFDCGKEADELLDACGDDPDEAVFYLFRAARREGKARAADLVRARKFGDSWRVGRDIVRHFESEGRYDDVFKTTNSYLSRYPGVDSLEIAHARSLLKQKRYRECLDFLKDVVLLPSEYGDSATDIWQEAQAALGEEKTWPENLGQGKPDDRK